MNGWRQARWITAACLVWLLLQQWFGQVGTTPVHAQAVSTPPKLFRMFELTGTTTAVTSSLAISVTGVPSTIFPCTVITQNVSSSACIINLEVTPTTVWTQGTNNITLAAAGSEGSVLQFDGTPRQLGVLTTTGSVSVRAFCSYNQP
jgi:hypothetical protein